jgi:nanoRNase/pAp phosphatase (c-di-AMP/oligoRNAs hydrolase)
MSERKNIYPTYVGKLLRFLKGNKKRLSPFLVLTHDYPDPDALASAFALQYLATRKYGIRTRIAYGGIVGRDENKKMVELLRLPIHRLTQRDFRHYRGIALVDTQPAFGNNSFPGSKCASIIIDQHPSVQPPAADFVVVDSDAGATSVILTEALLASKIEIPRNLATALAYGILSDTLNLHRNSGPRTVRAYLAVLSFSDMTALAQIQYPTRAKGFFKSFVNGLAGAEIRRRLIVSHLGVVENPDVVSQMADFLLTCEGMRWSFCTGRIRGFLHVSLRGANPTMDAGRVLRGILSNAGQAGGHGAVAGGQLRVGNNKKETTWVLVEQLLAQRIAERLQKGKERSIPLLKHT